MDPNDRPIKKPDCPRCNASWTKIRPGIWYCANCGHEWPRDQDHPIVGQETCYRCKGAGTIQLNLRADSGPTTCWICMGKGTIPQKDVKVK